ncbi:hypothetical protein DUI87_03527 [Hirundo rustica rustica]|uniref:dUTPase-like domain-containing protein n=1 Tax=Hirundo rustica rustica TaxID=333673 RepID=A0A3M0L0A5_HIRRU|nr:hypothetical protein DUI87_03527 [Hirundo rustica rustica]
MDVAAAVDVTIMTTNPLKIPTGLIGPIIINGQPDLSGFQLGGRRQHQNLKVEDIIKTSKWRTSGILSYT